MGYDLQAYLDFNQEELEEFITQNNIDRKDWNQSNTIANFYKYKYDIKQILYYNWNSNIEIHEIVSSYPTSFIRDDERFVNRRYHKILEKKYNKPFPYCLYDINFQVRTNHEAQEVAEQLRIFFPDDRDLMNFATWLDDTSKYCSTYELSY